MQSGTRESEKRVAATPASIKMLQNEGYKVAPRPSWLGGLPSGYVKIAIENGYRNSGFIDLPINSMVIFHSYLYVYQRV